MFRVVGVFILMMAASVLGGCTSAAIGVIDAKMSQITKQECSSANVLFGDSYCAPKVELAKQEEIHCYRTLGSVDCYRDENPYITEKSVRVGKVLDLDSEPLMQQPEQLAKDEDDDEFITTKMIKSVLNYTSLLDDDDETTVDPLPPVADKKTQ